MLKNSPTCRRCLYSSAIVIFWQRKIIAQEYERSVVFGVVIFYPTQFVGIIFLLIEAGELDRLVAEQASIAVYLVRINAPVFEVGFATN